MALDLLTYKYYDGLITRLYRHKEESLIRVLGQICLQDAKPVDSVSVKDWNMANVIEYARRKNHFLGLLHQFTRVPKYGAEWDVADELLQWVKHFHLDHDREVHSLMKARKREVKEKLTATMGHTPTR
ncbi:hypothetical protein BDQ12DRAFT_670135 [Crucibulum laeve]|uniref:Uncharacterized protein n=1 Tax=Crucibulum laeve TaxID=68775 RepID=A0A5C3LLK3_9AGAR|nr:hypothetical protein BDQ12DRAFT_670135 [Crucibulum laeve]